jgi:hypothetical protein
MARKPLSSTAADATEPHRTVSRTIAETISLPRSAAETHPVPVARTAVGVATWARARDQRSTATKVSRKAN